MFPCPECSKEFSTQGSLARHLHNHSQSAKHACNVCSVVFRRRDLLTRHLKLHAPDDASSHSREHDTGPNDSAAAEGGAGTVSRKRCHTACNRCRDLKIKCDGQNPCAKCRASRKPCDFDRPSGRISRMPVATEPRTSPAESGSASTAVQPSLPSFSPGVDDLDDAIIEPGACPGDAHDGSQHSFVDALLQWDPAVSDVVPWPWMHESLFLSGDGPGFLSALGSTDLGFTGGSIAEPGAAGGLDLAQHQAVALPGVTTFIPLGDEAGPGPGTAPAGPPLLGAAPISPPVDDGNRSQTLIALKHRAVEDLVALATSTGLASSRFGSPELWAGAPADLVSLFGLRGGTLTGGASAALDSFLALYKEHFHPLWPLLPRRNLNTGEIHPLLYLVLASIGAMYMGPAGSEFGALLHNAVRRRLVLPMELDETEDSLVWLAQARLLTQVSALYFGQPRAFSYAQHLGTLLTAQARRMCLFSATHHRHRVGQFQQMKGVFPDAERLKAWLSIEERRRLAFGIFRGDTFTSVLLNTKPLITLDEIGLGFPCCDEVWTAEDLDPRLALEMVEHDRTPSRDLLASDVYHVLLERNEMLPPLEPVAHEILLFGLQLPVWRFSRDRQVLEGLTGGRGFEGDFDDQNEHGTDDDNPPRKRRRRDTFTSEAESLDNRSYLMADLFAERRRLAAALSKWERALPLAKTLARTERDRSYVLSSLILYHLSFLRLYAPVEDIHQLHYRLADHRPVDPDLVARIREWTRSPKARIAVERVRSVWSLITQQTQLGRARSKFNFNAFVGLHHGAAILWAYSGAREHEADGSSVSSGPRGGGAGSSPTFSLHADKPESTEILKSFAELFHEISPAHWSSFAEVTELMSTLDFPRDPEGHV